MQKTAILFPLLMALVIIATQPGFAAPKTAGSGQPYPQFRSSYGTIRWISDQMPLKVFVAPGWTLTGFIDEDLGAPIVNVNNLDHWPDLVANVAEKPDLMQSLPLAQAYNAEQYQAAIQGINMWKSFEKEGLFSFTFTNDPADADIYVFWVNHFVDKMGLALFANDIRGYTAKRSFPLGPTMKAIAAGGQVDFKPVLIMLRTSDSNGTPMPFGKVRAAAAHEFGHALGIDQHSQNPNDLMSVYYGNGTISQNDAATIRYLYHLTPDLIP